MTKSSLILGMIDLLRRSPGLSVEELACAAGRSERTVYRWLSELSGDPQYRVKCHDGGYYLVGDASCASVNLTAEEILTIKLAIKSAVFLRNSPLAKHAAGAWQKIVDAAASSKLEAATTLAGSHSVEVTALSADINPKLLETIEAGIRGQRRLRVVYRSQKSGREKEYTIDPYAVAFRRHSWYVLAFSRQHGKVVQFKLTRFRAVEQTGEIFQRPADFSVEKHFGLSWEAWAGGEQANIVVRFSPRVAEMVAEGERHPTQVTSFEPDGSLLFKATVSGIEEIAIWIMGFGKDAEVLEPQTLCSLIAEHARGMVKTYGGISDLSSAKPLSSMPN